MESSMDTNMFYESNNNFYPVLNLAKALLNARGKQDVSNLINNSTVSVVNTDYDNWNGGTYGYTVYCSIGVKAYSVLTSEEIQQIEETISSALNEATKTDDSSFFHASILPSIKSGDIDWSLIGGQSGKNELKKTIEVIRDIMIMVSTGKLKIDDENARYQQLIRTASTECKKLNIPFTSAYSNLWDWYGKWKADLPTYQERRVFVNNMFQNTLSFFDETENDNLEVFVKLDEWERIKRTITKIKRDSISAKDEEDFQSIGLLCREVIISLAQTIYNPIIHGEKDEEGTEIGKSDAVRMIGNYITYQLKGKQHKELRDYVKSTNAIANQLTHKRSATKTDMLLTVSSTIALVNFIGILEAKF